MRRLEGSSAISALRPLPPYACGARIVRANPAADGAGGKKSRKKAANAAELAAARTRCLIGLVPAAGHSELVAECEAAVHELEVSLIVRAKTDAATNVSAADGSASSSGSKSGGAKSGPKSGWYQSGMALQGQLLTNKELKVAYM